MEFRDLLLKMNQETIVICNLVLNELANTFALVNSFDITDYTGEEENDEKEYALPDEVDQNEYLKKLSKYQRLVYQSPLAILKEFMDDGEIFTRAMIQDIEYIYNYRTVVMNLEDSPFNPKYYSLDYLGLIANEFYKNVLTCIQVYIQLKSVNEEMLDYGVEPYLVDPEHDLDKPYNKINDSLSTLEVYNNYIKYLSLETIDNFDIDVQEDFAAINTLTKEIKKMEKIKND